MAPCNWIISALTCWSASEQYALAAAARSPVSAAPCCGGLGRRVRERPGRLDEHVHLGHPVLERLEAADGPAELDPDLGVGDGQRQRGRRRAGLLGAQRDAGRVPDPVQGDVPPMRRPAAPSSRTTLSRRD